VNPSHPRVVEDRRKISHGTADNFLSSWYSGLDDGMEVSDIALKVHTGGAKKIDWFFLSDAVGTKKMY
jgi:hypothetical protein